MDWQVAEAKNRFSELLDRAHSEGPQRVRRRGKVVLVVSEADFAAGKYTVDSTPNFLEHLLSLPSLEGVDLNRDKSAPRTLQL